MEKKDKLRVIAIADEEHPEHPPEIRLPGFGVVEVEIPPQNPPQDRFRPEYAVAINEKGEIFICRIPGYPDTERSTVKITVRELLELLSKDDKYKTGEWPICSSAVAAFMQQRQRAKERQEWWEEQHRNSLKETFDDHS